MKFIDLSGKRFGRLKAVSSVTGRQKWNCRCDCGESVQVFTTNLRRGLTRSCGCINREIGMKRITHGMSKSLEYRCWQAMLSRCLNPKNIGFHNYGGAGVRVCDRWRHSFENFLADMGEAPFAGASIDRKDNKGNYDPGNCRWATRQQQNNNKTSNRMIDIEGKTQSLAEWSRELGVNPYSVSTRIQRGWDDVDALLKPFNVPNRKMRTVNG
jgi:hypothetical protein